jgi:membrane protein implicated in regulation of membrane protease activity
MRQHEGFHYGPCSTASGGVLRVLLLAAVIGAVVFWPTLVAVATIVALILKITLIAVAIVAVLATAAAIASAARRRRSTPTASALAIQPEHEQRIEHIESQLVALTAAVERLERDRTPALTAPAHIAALDPRVLAALAQLAAITDSAGQRSRAVTERWDGR